MSQEPSKEIKAVVDRVLGAFNSKKSKLFNDSFGGEVAIIDGFAPFSLNWIRMLKRVGGPGPSDGVRNSASEHISLLKRRFIARWLELAPTLSFQR